MSLLNRMPFASMLYWHSNNTSINCLCKYKHIFINIYSGFFSHYHNSLGNKLFAVKLNIQNICILFSFLDFTHLYLLTVFSSLHLYWLLSKADALNVTHISGDYKSCFAFSMFIPGVRPLWCEPHNWLAALPMISPTGGARSVLEPGLWPGWAGQSPASESPTLGGNTWWFSWPSDGRTTHFFRL